MKFTFPVCTAAHCTGEIYCVQDNQMDLGSKEMTNNLENFAGTECMQIIRIVCLVIDWLSDWAGGRLWSFSGGLDGSRSEPSPWHGADTQSNYPAIAAPAFNFDFDLRYCDAYTIFGDVGKIDLTASFKMWQNVLSQCQCASSPKSVYLSHYRCQNSSTPLSSYQSEDPPPAHWNLWIIALQLCCECYAAFVPTQSNNRIRCFPFD